MARCAITEKFNSQRERKYENLAESLITNAGIMKIKEENGGLGEVIFCHFPVNICYELRSGVEG